MKIKLVSASRFHENYIDEGVNAFHKRLTHYVKIEIITLKTPQGLDVTHQLKEESKYFSKFISPDTIVCLLDENGIAYTSLRFAGFLRQKLNSGKKNLVFIIGGSHGFSEDIKSRANHLISLSSLTFPHQLAKLIFIEQLYRAYTILQGEKYHHE